MNLHGVLGGIWCFVDLALWIGLRYSVLQVSITVIDNRKEFKLGGGKVNDKCRMALWLKNCILR